MKRISIILLSLCIVMFSCLDGLGDSVDTDPVILLEKVRIDFFNMGGSHSVSFATNKSWIASPSADWCIVSTTKGDKTVKNITITVAANNTSDDRKCIVTIVAGSLSRTIAVNQGENLTLLVSKEDMEHQLSNDENTIEVEVKANVEFEVDVRNDWITRVDTRSLTSSNLRFNIAKNEAYNDRVGYIVIKQKDGPKLTSVKVVQSQVDAIIISDKVVNLSKEEQKIEVELNTNVFFEVIVPNNAENWVFYRETRSMRREKVFITVANNSSSIPRTTEVYIKDKSSNVQDTLTINQASSEPSVYTVTKGALSEMLAGSIYSKSLQQLTIKGELDRRDFDAIAKQMPSLRFLDLSEVKCEDNKIPDYAFGGDDEGVNKNITVILPTSIKTIGRGAFEGCVGFGGILELPEGLETIESNAFYGCTGLSGPLVFPDNLTTIGDGAFYGCSGLSSLALPAKLKTIGNIAFKGCSSLAGSLTLPDGLTAIGAGAFEGCSAFTGSLSLPEGLTLVEMRTFGGCKGFDGTLNLPAKLEQIGWGAFYDCSGFTGSLTLPNVLKTIESNAFKGCSGFTGVLTLPEGLTTLGVVEGDLYYGAFEGCSGFTSLKLPNRLKAVGSRTFKDCSGLIGSLNLSNNLISIGSEAFKGCTGLTGLLFGNSIETIHNSAFRNCSNISGKVVFPMSLSSIRKEVFIGCHKVDAFRFPHLNPLQHYGTIFPAEATVEVPKEAVNTYKSASGWKDCNIVEY